MDCCGADGAKADVRIAGLRPGYLTPMTQPATPIQVVWFKRDLRVHDHRPLAEAAARGPVLPLYLYEPSLISQVTTDARHIDFLNECLTELDTDLRQLGVPLIRRHGEAVDTLQHIHDRYTIAGLWAHQETSDLAGYARDNDVRRWARRNDIAFTEHLDRGVFRRQPTRDGWSKRWKAVMAQPIEPAPSSITAAPAEPGHTRHPIDLGLTSSRATDMQPGGRAAGLGVLASFLSERAEPYATAMSSPVTAFEHSSRLSPYLAFGSLSGREVHQATIARIEVVRDDPERGSWLKSLRAFERRLHWRDHFTQKLEDQPSLETEAMHPMLDEIRGDEADQQRFDAFCTGHTGYPMVDACIRSTIATGWLNFRMRAMVVSFASYHLWLDWRPVAHFLARQWTDYEPGIHYPQHQMQAGVTGINALRIYSPTKQVTDQDPTGIFIRRWLPELQEVPDEHLAEPSLMSSAIQKETRCLIGTDYPPPIVDHATATKAARRVITDIRKTPEAKAISDKILARHGSRKPRPRRRSASSSS